MKLDEIIKIFIERLTDIELYQRAANKTAKKEFYELNKYAEQLRNNPSLESLGTSMDVMSFRDPHTGTALPYGFRESSVEERQTQVLLQKNKQFCWLLAEAYEEFEDFLESIYAYIGKNDNTSWPLSDFGNISLSDIPTKNYEWYLERAKNKQNKKSVSESILNRLRSLYPNIVNIETKNNIKANLKVAIELIAQLRHIIVHKRGIVEDRNAFLETVLKSSGVWNNGKYNSGYKDFVEKFFGNGKFENVISLLEVKINHGKPIPFEIQHDRFRELSGYLVAYAVHIYQCISGEEKKCA